jgi:serine O-acetyltransferase
VGSNAVVLREVPPGATMVGIPARQVGPQPAAKERCFPAYGVEPGVTIDPVSRAIDRLTQQVEELTARVAQLEQPVEQAPEPPAEERRVAAS